MKSPRLAILAVAALCIVNSPAKAQTFNHTSGTRAWDLKENWSTDPLPFPNGSGTSATFLSVSSAINVDLNVGITVGSITVTNSSSSLFRIRASGGSLTLANSGPANFTVNGTSSLDSGVTVTTSVTLTSSLNLTVNNAVPVTNAVEFAGNISGGGGLDKLGTGTAILSGANSFTGGTTISAGKLILTGANDFGTATTTIAAGATLQVGNGASGGSLTGTGAINNSGSLVFNRDANQGDNGLISGNGTVTKSGTGTLTLNIAHSYSGGTTISAGKLLANAGATNSATGSGTVTVGSGGSLGGSGRVGAVNVQTGGTIFGGNGTNTDTLRTGNVTISAGGILAATIGLSGSDSSLNVGAGILDLATGSKLNLSSAGFNRSLAGTYTIAAFTGSNKLRIDGMAPSGNLGTYIHGTGATGAVIIDVSSLGTLNAGDQFVLTYAGTAGSDLVLNFTPVPEPTTVLAIAVGALGCGGLVRRRFRKLAEATTAV